LEPVVLWLDEVESVVPTSEPAAFCRDDVEPSVDGPA
jgi:hypothetical protein